MKKYFNIALITAGLSVLLSCNAMLDIDPESDITESVFPRNTSELNALVIGVYSGLRAPIQLEWRFTELRSDNTWQAEKGSATQINRDLDGLDQFSPRVDMPEIYNYWYWTYQYISAANLVIRNLHVALDTEAALKAQFEAEARFLRALGHFNLVRLFGPIFLMDDLRTPQEARRMNRAPVEQIYEFIIDDLTFASENLPARHTAANVGRATTWAARTLLAKVHMTMQNFDLALPLLREVQNSWHDLELSAGSAGSAFANVFSLNNEMPTNDEIIFAVRFNGEAGLGSRFSNDFAPLNSLQNVVNMGTSRGLNAATWDLFDSFAEYDTIRRDASIGLWRGIGGDEEDRIRQRLYPRKFITNVIGADQSSQDFPILRFADVLLMLAETINEIDGPTSEVFVLINSVRNRAGIASEHNVSTDSRLEAREIIENERRWELAFENHRWHDLVRTGRAIEVIERQIFEIDFEYYLRYAERAPIRGQIVQPWQLLLPIPLREIDANNDIIITQNFGY
ncbi:MAG: RagB/SusD family nutrient uptake outer membrane protein [Bacteroidales bacterium]|nr:RagB/SusD family nutrient uptake outer membrane protein [Bacteroidales bacterium]